MSEGDLDLKQLTAHCGAEVRGIDLARSLDGQTVESLVAALAEHGVLFFRDQNLTPPQQKGLGRRFGELHLHPMWPRLVEGHPEVMEVFSDENTVRIAGEHWHSDVSCDAEPPMGTIFYMLETPPVGGDTLFANACAAYEALSEPVRQLITGLTAEHDGEKSYGRGYGEKVEKGRTFPKNVHPVVRTHPVSGRKGLFVNPTFTTRIVELCPHESDAVLALLYRQIEQPEFQCRFRWEPGSVAFWDNRSAQHHAMWDYYPNRRRGLRVTIKGDAPF